MRYQAQSYVCFALSLLGIDKTFFVSCLLVFCFFVHYYRIVLLCTLDCQFNMWCQTLHALSEGHCTIIISYHHINLFVFL